MYIIAGVWQPNNAGCTSDAGIYLEKKIEFPPKKNLSPPSKAPVASPRKVKPPVALREKVKTEVKLPATTPVATGKTPELRAPVRLPESVTLRETDVQSLLEISPQEKDSIKVEVYDNGEIDGDSVSVYEDDLLRINKKKITASPITFYVTLDKNRNPISHLRLVAESLGSIPPCTALMIVTTKTKRYEVHLSSSFQKNATLELFLKE